MLVGRQSDRVPNLTSLVPGWTIPPNDSPASGEWGISKDWGNSGVQSIGVWPVHIEDGFTFADLVPIELTGGALFDR